MSSLESLTIEELKILTKARFIDGYENTSTQQLDSIFTTRSTLKPTQKPASKSKKPTLLLKPKKNEPNPSELA